MGGTIMKKLRIIQVMGIALAVLMLPTAAAFADQKVDFDYMKGDPSAALAIGGKPLPKGTILMMHVRPEHPLRLTQIEIAYWGTADAPVEVHIWRDNGGSQPGGPTGTFTEDEASELLAPIAAKTGANGEWQSYTFGDKPPEFLPLQQFWIGVKILEEGANVAIDKVDQKQTELTGLLQTPADPCADGCGVPGNLAIRAHGNYFNVLDKFMFSEVSKEIGLTVGGRMAFGDYDNDGDDDILFGGSTLYRNDGKGHFVDMSVEASLTAFGGNGALWGDYDNDGFLDIWVFGGTEHLLHNEGNGTFVEVGAGQFFDSDHYPTEAAMWVDIDNDGKLDIYDANFEWYHKDANGGDVLGECGVDFVWHNEGGGKFKEIGQALGVRKYGAQCGRGLAAADWDQDGDFDIFVNDYRLKANHFWRNDFPAQIFVDIAKTLGVKGSGKQAAFGQGTGAQWVDADNDGDFDLFVANLAHPRFIAFSDKSGFFRNEGADKDWKLTDLREQTGIAYAETQSAPSFADFDNDGDMDLVVGAYYGDRMGQFWRNDGAAKDPANWLQFSDITYQTQWKPFGCASIAWADIDGDGDLDCAANNLFYRNQYNEVAGAKGHYLKVRVHGAAKVNRAAIGTWVTVETGNGQILTRLVSGGQGLATQDSLTLHFGLGKADQVTKITVHWPGLAAETFGPYGADQTIEVVEGKGATGVAPGAGHVDPDAATGGVDGSSGDTSGADAAAAPAAAPTSGCTAHSTANSDSGWIFAGCALGCLLLRGRRQGVAVA